MNRRREEMLHAGELEAQARFEKNGVWPDQALGRMLRTAVDEETALFIEGLQFFFIATSGPGGHCDCSFRGTEPGADGAMQPALRVMDPHTLVFPDYRGNRLYNSLGNILVNPHIGLLFLDFPSASRLRVNGAARIIETPDTYRHIWSTALRYVEVTVEQVFGNCSRRIPSLP